MFFLAGAIKIRESLLNPIPSEMPQALKSKRFTSLLQDRRARVSEQTQANRTDSYGAARSEKLKVSGIEHFPVKEPVSGRRYSVVKVLTEDGFVGFGEGGPATSREFAAAGELLIGLPATASEVARKRLAEIPSLKAAVNTALLDIVGRFSKAPIYQVLGGPTRFKARGMTPLIGESNESLIEALNVARNAGFRAFMVPLPTVAARNQGRAFVLAARKRLEQLREAGGEESDFVLDGAGVLSPGDASSLASEFERFHLLWFDEPCQLTNLSPIRKIAAETVTPIGFGRFVSNAGVFQDLLREQLIDILRPSLAGNGISEIRKMAALSETYYVAVAPHHDGGPIGTAAALHLAASLPNFFVQQIPRPAAEADRRMRAELAGVAAERVEDGYAILPTGPGLGISVNEEALKKYRDSGV